MGLFRRKTGLTLSSDHPLAGREASIESHLRQSWVPGGPLDIVSPQLVEGEEVINVFRVERPASMGRIEVVLTSMSVIIFEIGESGVEISPWPHDKFAGMRLESGFVRLHYFLPGGLNTAGPTVRLGVDAGVAFYAQFCEAWSRQAGYPFEPSRQLNQPTVPPIFEA